MSESINTRSETKYDLVYRIVQNIKPVIDDLETALSDSDSDFKDTLIKYKYHAGLNFFRPAMIRDITFMLETNTSMRTYISIVSSRLSLLLSMANITKEDICSYVSDSLCIIGTNTDDQIYILNKNFRTDMAIVEQDLIEDISNNYWHAYLYIYLVYSQMVDTQP